MSNKSVLRECQIRVPYKSVKQEVSSKSVLQESQVRSVTQVCQIRVSSKSVLPEHGAIVSSKGVLQECHLSVSTQGVSQVGSLENVRHKYCLCSSHTCRHSGSWASSCFLNMPVH